MPPRLIIHVSVCLNLSCSSPSTTVSLPFHFLHLAVFTHCLSLFSICLLPLCYCSPLHFCFWVCSKVTSLYCTFLSISLYDLSSFFCRFVLLIMPLRSSQCYLDSLLYILHIIFQSSLFLMLCQGCKCISNVGCEVAVRPKNYY